MWTPFLYISVFESTTYLKFTNLQHIVLWFSLQSQYRVTDEAYLLLLKESNFVFLFEKAFDTRLKNYLYASYMVMVLVERLKWIDSFLCFRQQRVVVNGIKSDWSPFCQVSHRTPFLDHCCSYCILTISQQIRLFAGESACVRSFANSTNGIPIPPKSLVTIGTNGMPMVITGCQPVLPLVANLADNQEGRQN